MHLHTSLAVTALSRGTEAPAILTLWLKPKSPFALLQLTPPLYLPGTPRLFTCAAAAGVPHDHSDQAYNKPKHNKFEVFERALQLGVDGTLADPTDRRIEEEAPTRRVQQGTG
jgi:hypothetical protein